jgi:hypothetical protein
MMPVCTEGPTDWSSWNQCSCITAWTSTSSSTAAAGQRGFGLVRTLRQPAVEAAGPAPLAAGSLLLFCCAGSVMGRR